MLPVWQLLLDCLHLANTLTDEQIKFHFSECPLCLAKHDFFFFFGNVSSLVTPSAFHRNVSASTPGFSQECRMENVQLSFFPHFSPPGIPPGTHSLLKRISSTACPESTRLRVNPRKGFCGVCTSLAHTLHSSSSS